MSDNNFPRKGNSCGRTGAGGRSRVPASPLQHALRMSLFATYCLVFVVFGVASVSANTPAYNDGDEIPVGRDMNVKLSRKTRLLRAGTAGIPNNVHGNEDGDVRPQQQQQHQHHNMNNHRRNLDEMINDPKTVELKPEPQVQLPPAQMVDALEPPLPSSSEQNLAAGPAPLSILSLGGSVTWGATLEDRTKAYPWMVGNAFGGAHVDNLAFRATGADFPSLCIESLIEEAGSAERSYDLVSVPTRHGPTVLFINAFLAREREISWADMHACISSFFLVCSMPLAPLRLVDLIFRL
jgi:hypothetical protein